MDNCIYPVATVMAASVIVVFVKDHKPAATHPVYAEESGKERKMNNIAVDWWEEQKGPHESRQPPLNGILDPRWWRVSHPKFHKETAIEIFTQKVNIPKLFQLDAFTGVFNANLNKQNLLIILSKNLRDVNQVLYNFKESYLKQILKEETKSWIIGNNLRASKI